MAPHVITITHGDPITGELILDKPDLAARTGDRVKWIIQSSEVSSIDKILDKTGNNVWKTRPKRGNSWMGKIKDKDEIPSRNIYEYSIWWIPKGGSTPLEHDPKISIDPSKGVSKVFLLLGMAATSLLTLFCISLLLDKKRSGK